MDESDEGARDALEQFKSRMHLLRSECGSITTELARADMVALARRTRDLLRLTRGLLDGNVGVLFAGQPPRTHQDLYTHLEYAEIHITKALSEEFEFHAIDRRLFMATRLAEYVINGIGEAVLALEERLESEASA